MRKTPIASGCLEAPRIGTNGDITPKGLLSALQRMSRNGLYAHRFPFGIQSVLAECRLRSGRRSTSKNG